MQELTKYTLPQAPPKNRPQYLSTETEAILENRKQAAATYDIETFTLLTKQYRKSKQADKKRNILDTISTDLDLRDRWAGIKRLKTEYKPTPYHRKNERGDTIATKDTAEAFAKHLENEIWNRTDTPIEEINKQKLPGTENLPYNLEDITEQEVNVIIKRLKRRKATGPDSVPIELLKECNQDTIAIITEILNHWWNTTTINQEYLQAQICLIYKKGNTANLDNYRPIALLNTLYKIYTAIIKIRLSDQLDKHLQKTQFGFRKDKSTADAIHCVRRLAEHGEQTQQQTILVLLDWAKAFDKVNREALYIAMEKMNIHTKMIKVIKSIYTNTQFNITIEGHTSDWHTQHTGIRQGCPLSPYLFLIIMTTMFYDIHKEDKQNLIPHRIPGITFDEVLYADDTICVSTDTKAMNKLIKSIEIEGDKYGLKLNHSKCEALYKGTTTINLKYKDGTKIPRKTEVTYLGCKMNQQCKTQTELSKRISTCMLVLKRLDLFWRHSNCPNKFKISVLDAVIRAKVLYGLDSAQLTVPQQRKLETFQLKGIRKILKIKTTFIERTNTNQKVFDQANEQIKNNTPSHKKPKLIIPFTTTFKKQRIKLLKRIINMTDDNIIREVTFKKGEIYPAIPPLRRVGAPKYKWAIETAKDLWAEIKHLQPNNIKTLPFNINNKHIQNALILAAKTQQNNTTPPEQHTQRQADTNTGQTQHRTLMHLL